MCRYYGSQQLTTKSDVFSLGVVMLEVVCGREPILAALRGDPDANIVNWARKLVQDGDVQGLVDPALKSNYKMRSVERVVYLALRCVDPYSRNRPTMPGIVLEINEAMRIETSSEYAYASRSMTDSMTDSMRSDVGSPSGIYNYEIDSSSDEVPPSVLLSRSQPTSNEPAVTSSSEIPPSGLLSEPSVDLAAGR
ncbi:hypothetical protein R1sor_018382 [Riccia sorocarpa]|uniref:Protein kinase domain-containing protein n=1 Tax=Riccia sorocarpa TaxID=122646 RepID=A0ABD3ID39_9MARC